MKAVSRKIWEFIRPIISDRDPHSRRWKLSIGRVMSWILFGVILVRFFLHPDVTPQLKEIFYFCMGYNGLSKISQVVANRKENDDFEKKGATLG